MGIKYQALKGMEDLLPGEIEKWQWLEEKARTAFRVWGFAEIRTPILESTELFSRSIGETSDIVNKEMFSFVDRGGRNVTLRPEMTASVARAVIEHGLLKTNKSLRLYYLGPMFRAERPQAGRKRQFNQIGVELVNEGGMSADSEMINVLYSFFNYLKLSKRPKLKINDLTRINGPEGETIRAKLKRYFESHRSKLDKDSLYRLDKNVLRIFDSKVPEMQPILESVPWEEIDPLDKKEDFQELLKDLKARYIPYEVSHRLVRGLDYYTGVVFEVTSEVLGAQDALAGGGRYDNLYKELGNAPTPCTGFSIGMERLLTVLEKNQLSINDQIRKKFVYVVSLTTNWLSQEAILARKTTASLLESGFRAECTVPLSRFTLTDHLQKANKLGAAYVVIIGSDEIKSGKLKLKYMDEQREESIESGQLIFALTREMKELPLI